MAPARQHGNGQRMEDHFVPLFQPKPTRIPLEDLTAHEQIRIERAAEQRLNFISGTMAPAAGRRGGSRNARKEPKGAEGKPMV